MASRLLLLPGGLNTETIDRIHVQPLWKELWPGWNPAPWYVCICEQGRGGKRWEAEALKATLESLLQPTPEYPLAIEIVDLGWDNIEDHLARCDVFYMCGGAPHVFAGLFRTYQKAMGVLANCIRGGELLYIGSCGGSCMMSSSYAGENALQIIPGIISISASEAQIEVSTNDDPHVMMRCQTSPRKPLPIGMQFKSLPNANTTARTLTNAMCRNWDVFRIDARAPAPL